MTEDAQPGWTRLLTATGRYDYQFQGEMPTVRGGQYEEARDYQFLVPDDEGWLYKLPCVLSLQLPWNWQPMPHGCESLKRNFERALKRIVPVKAHLTPRWTLNSGSTPLAPASLR